MKIILFATIFVLLGNALAIQRDYQDSWILEGLEMPFLLFVVAYAAAFFFETRMSWLVALAVTSEIVFLLLPNFKYVWFQGLAIDQHVQYALADQVVISGHISTAMITPYVSTPLEHLSFSVFSIVFGVPVVDAMKYLPVLWSSIYPLLTYVIVSKLDFQNRSAILKYALFISSIPFSQGQFVVIGGLFGTLLVFLILSTIVTIFVKGDRRYWLICVVFVFALAAGHSVSSVILSVSLLLVAVLQRLSRIRLKSYLRVSTALAIGSIGLLWLVFSGTVAWQYIVTQLFVAVPQGTTPSSEYITPTFFEHARVNLLSALGSFSVFYGADAIFLLIAVGALVVLMIKRKELKSVSNFLLMLGFVVFGLMAVGYVLKLGAPRMLQFTWPLFPVLSGIFIVNVSKSTFARKFMCPLLLLSILILAPIELYACQPLISSANVLYKNVPPAVPIVYVNSVNSVYQRELIDFAEKHVEGTVAAVDPTINQLIDLTGTDFPSRANVIAYYPFDTNQTYQKYDCFLFNLPGKNGFPTLNPQLLAPSVMLEGINNSNILYTNGGSFALAQGYIRP